MIKQQTILTAATALFLMGAATPAFAEMEYIPKQDTSKVMDEGIQSDGAMDYFASGKHNKNNQGMVTLDADVDIEKHNEMVAKQKQLPSEATLGGGKAKIKVDNGMLVTKSAPEKPYVDCTAFRSETPENTPDECQQQRSGSDAPIEEVGNNAAVPNDATNTGNFLRVPADQVTADMENVGNNPAPVTTDSNVVKEISIMDRKNNVQTNIISNTDTGVDIGE